MIPNYLPFNQCAAGTDNRSGYRTVGLKKEPVPVIFDTDMGPDYDDVGAITLTARICR